MIQEAPLNLQGEDYQIWHDCMAETTYFQGILRLSGKPEYEPIANLLAVALEQSQQFTLDLRELEFLNSSGITMLTMFIVKVRNKETVPLTIQGSNKILWQTKSLRNLKRLMPNLTLSFS